MTDNDKALRAHVRSEMLRLAIEFAGENEKLAATLARAEAYTMWVLELSTISDTRMMHAKALALSKSN